MDSKALPPAKPSHIKCPACQQEKERKEFKRLASLAQTRAWLKKPTASKRLWYVGNVCNACNPKRKAADIAPSELEKILIRNDVNTEIAKARIENRKAAGTKSRAKGAIKALKQRRLAHFDRHKAEITKLTAVLSTRLAYIKKKKDPNQYDLMRYLRYAATLCKVARQTMTREGRAGHAAPVNWQAAIKPDDIVTLQQLRRNLDSGHKLRVDAIHNTLTAPVSKDKIDDTQRRELPMPENDKPKAEPPAWLIFGEQEKPKSDLSWVDDLMK